MDHVPLMLSGTTLSAESFWRCVLVYHDMPHVVNRKLAAIKPLLLCELSADPNKVVRSNEYRKIFTREALLYHVRKLPDLTQIDIDFVRQLVEPHFQPSSVRERDWSAFHDSPAGMFVSVRMLMPRRMQNKFVEVVFFEKKYTRVLFLAAQEYDEPCATPRFPYQISLNEGNNLKISLDNFEDADTNSAVWLAKKLFPKLLNWSEGQDSKAIKSLSLISAVQYCDLYTEMKTKYGAKLVQAWRQKAKTDPCKYVYEDIAIATYLMCVWSSNKANVNFVDCGCGNGLLVYILNGEGYKGCGLDVRRRTTWELYQGKADLREGTITPESTFPDATWIIGNHSDELTPWIPIIACKSSPKTNYFVLPCCSHDLSGQKYVRRNSAATQYGDYLDYIKEISTICGFATSIDKLRIPSTKRICLLGVRDDFDEATMPEIHRKVSEFIQERQNSEFVARNPVEKIRNCTQLNRSLIDRIVDLVAKQLLDINNLIPQPGEKTTWNQGGNIGLEHLIKKLTPEDRKALKAECGGLQTLLKNHRYIFDVRGGTVSLRKPLSVVEDFKYKNKPCWYHLNHPRGCFYQADVCAYKH